MQNSKTIPAGATVYFCRRGLDYRYATLMKVETARVKSRTPLGYKFESRHTLGLHLDKDYYISESREEVEAAVRRDIVAAVEAVNRLIDGLELAAAKL